MHANVGKYDNENIQTCMVNITNEKWENINSVIIHTWEKPYSSALWLQFGR